MSKLRLGKTNNYLRCNVCNCMDWSHDIVRLTTIENYGAGLNERILDSLICWDCGNTVLFHNGYSTELNGFKYQIEIY